MKRTLLSMAIFSAMVVMSSGASAVEFLENATFDQFHDDGTGLSIGSGATFDGQGNDIRVTGSMSNESWGPLKFGVINSGTIVDFSSLDAKGVLNLGSLNSENGTISVSKEGTNSGLFINSTDATVVIGSIISDTESVGGSPTVLNNGELTVKNSFTAKQIENDGVLKYDGTAPVVTNNLLNVGKMYVSSGALTIDGQFWLGATSNDSVAVLGKNEDEHLDTLRVTRLWLGIDQTKQELEGEYTLKVNGKIDADYVYTKKNIEADALVVKNFLKIYSNKTEDVAHVTVRELHLDGEGKKSTVGTPQKGNGYEQSQLIVHDKVVLGSGHQLQNYGYLLLDGEAPVIEGDGIIENLVYSSSGSDSVIGTIAKDLNSTKIDALTINGTLNNVGEVYAKNFSVKNGYDGTTDEDSVAFDVDNLTVMEAGEFALNSTSTDLQTVTISKDATLTANKTVNLSGAASVSNNGGTATFGEVNSENLNVYGTSGQTTIAKARMRNQVGVTLDSGTVTIDDLETQKLDVTINNLEGNKLDVAKVNDDVNASVTVSSQANTGAAQDVIDKVMGSVAIGTDNATDVDYLITAKPGLITDGFTTQSNDPTTIHTTKNPTMDAFGSVTALSALTLRHEMNSLSKRMGELRDAPAGVGVWARAYGSEMEYGAQDVKAKNNSVQMGADYTLGDWKVGAAFSYTDGESSYESGKADNKNYGLALYGTWFVPCGAYVDLIAKYTHMDNDFTMGGLDGSFDNDAFNVSAETGYRFNFMDGGVYVEPQVGLSYGYVKGESFAAGQGVTIEQDDYDSFIGRVGVRTGFKFPKDKGTIYARISGVYDFNGEVNARAYNTSASNTIESDMGGAWLEMGVGANFNWTKNTYTYIDFERTNGGDVKENYRWNVGVRHTF